MEATGDCLAGDSAVLQRLILREQAPFGDIGVQSPFCSGYSGASPPITFQGSYGSQAPSSALAVLLTKAQIE